MDGIRASRSVTPATSKQYHRSYLRVFQRAYPQDMPAPRWLAEFNRSVTNPLLSGMARYLPCFGIVHHTGRRSGLAYENPVCVFRFGSIYTIALTYGPKADWVRNVLAKEGCTLETQGRQQQLVQPFLLYDPERRAVPPLVARLLGLLRVNHFLELRAL